MHESNRQALPVHKAAEQGLTRKEGELLYSLYSS